MDFANWQNSNRFIYSQISPNVGFCGQLDPFVVLAKTKRVYMHFESDKIAEKNGKGFNATFQVKAAEGWYDN